MGAGKTTIGRRLAHDLGLHFVDSDHEIETSTGVDIGFIFEKEGEAGFRARESRMLARLTAGTGVVLATGGGAVLVPGNRALLASRGFVVYLYAGIDQQLARTERSDNRPLLADGNRRLILERLLAQRDPLYRDIADLVIETGHHRLQAMVREIERVMAQRQTESAR
ncbi:MAG: shikimate kinase [Gammaproteobacteria bacterium]|nr:shikimate kinase [Gammaproteobacteria bacterium]